MKRFQVLVITEEGHAVVLSEVLDVLWSRHQVVNRHSGHAPIDPTDDDTSDLELRLIVEIGCQPPILPDIRAKPWLDDNHATRHRMASQGGDGLVQSRHGGDVADRAAETEHGVKLATEIEVD